MCVSFSSAVPVAKIKHIKIKLTQKLDTQSETDCNRNSKKKTTHGHSLYILDDLSNWEICKEPVMETFPVEKYFVSLNFYILNIHHWKYFGCLIFAIELSGKNCLTAKIYQSTVCY